ncbi:hypothetical protein Y032_0028g1653 [Ancylostoma ceylanicum]|uniref:Unspecific monooxygenase n=1 Tax=Ancylostoma ceylanicum TaxID=53326 RepID=A0A016USB3_9BILA|nr:hypothetical protein Y032_0028g1653 [Ancylostoma ceylanicum]
MLVEPLICGVAFIAVFLIFEWIKLVRRYPPGPFPLPLIGNLHHVLLGRLSNGGICETMKKWRKEYGDVFTFWLGPIPTVHIADFAIAKEEMITNGASYVSRYTPYMLDVKREGRGTAFSSGDYWADHRRFSLRTLRNFGLGSNVVEERIMDEFNYHFSKLEKTMINGQVKVNAGKFFDILTGSVINRMIFSERFTDENAEEFFRLKREIDDTFVRLNAFDFALEKWTMNLPLIKQRWKTMTAPQEKLVNFIDKRVAQRKQDIATGKHHIEEDGHDFVDAYILKVESDRKEGVDSSRMYKEDGLIYDAFDLWIAGHETTSLTMLWGFSYLIQNPDVVTKIRNELNAVTNGNRNIALTDKNYTPYMNWAILEIQRLASILNLNLWRKTEKDCIVGGCNVPRGTAITAELSLIMSDEKYFENPEKFDPDRYERGGKALEQRVIPFGLGKRACIGESLAKAEIYLVLSNMISRYDIMEDPETPINTATTTPDGMMRRANNYNMILKMH